jgi:hypothetical protein
LQESRISELPLLKFSRPGHDYAKVDCAQIIQQSKIVEIAIIEWVLVVPFDFEGNPVLEAINAVSRRRLFNAVDDNFRVKRFFNPAEFV